MEGANIQRRLWGFGGLFACVLAGLAVRLVYVQAIHPYLPDHLEDTGRKVMRPARRGEILDARGNVLAKSRLVYSIHADPVVIGTNAAVLARYMDESRAIFMLFKQAAKNSRRF